MILFVALPPPAPERLTCELKSVFEDSVKIHASAEIQVGDRILRLASPDCGEGVACQIDCYLQNGSARESLGH